MGGVEEELRLLWLHQRMEVSGFLQANAGLAPENEPSN
jgi:hypothetical protein